MNSPVARLRTLLILGRVSNLPTVWSNCLAGWWLGGGGDARRLALLCAGATFLYTGGMFLNDAFDADFDRIHRKERPLPASLISLAEVWRWGLLWLGAGALGLILLGFRTGALGVALLLAIVTYDAVHKQFMLAPLIMGLCRFLLYTVAASSGHAGVTGESLWCAIALAAYVTGLSFWAREESVPGPARHSPLLLLVAPVGLALLMNNGEARPSALLLSAVLALWIIRSLRQGFRAENPAAGQMISGLLAGIVLVDWLALVQAPRQLSFAMLGLFLLANLLQRVVPAS